MDAPGSRCPLVSSPRGAVFRVIVLVMALIVCVSGDVQIKQVNTDTTESWFVHGIATYFHGGSNPTVFYFQCTSTVNNGADLSWSKVGGPLGHTQGVIAGGVELRIDPPVASSAGTYICTDSATSEEARFELTDDDPAASVSASSLEYYAGDTAVIEMYASTVDPPDANTITWTKDGEVFQQGTFSNHDRTLTIPNLKLSNAGSYKLVITIGEGLHIASAFAVTTLQVNVPPTVISHPQDTVKQEWDDVNLTCIATGNLTLTITWHRADGSSLPDSHSITTSTTLSVTTSTLTIEDLRTIDSGSYYCNVTDGNRYNPSNAAELTVTNNIRLTNTAQDGEPNRTVLIEPILLLLEPGVIDCEGSGSHYWTGPNNNNISMDTTSTPYQHTVTETGFTRLNYTSVTLFPNGVYSCVSSSITRSIYITKDNPAIYTEQDELAVGAISNTVLRVYVTGNNPAPTSNDITWYFNGASLPSMTEYYQLENGNKNLVISNVSSNITVGRYRATVSTTQGSQSVYINVSYFDPPVVTVVPDPNNVYTLREGNIMYFNCTVTSVLDVTLSWYNSSSGLPILNSGSGLLKLSNVTHYDQGEYYCEAVDEDRIHTVRQTVTIIVEYKPIVTLSTTSDSHEEGKSNPTYFCSVMANPQANVAWRFNGGPLPDRVNEIYDNNNGWLLIHWNRPVIYSDNGTYTCNASNAIGTSFVELHLTVYARPNITTIYSTGQTTSIKAIAQSSALVLFKTSLISNDTLTCIAHGLPAPSLYWVDSNGNELTNIYTVNKCGTAVATLSLNHKNISHETIVSCRVSNNQGIDSQSIKIINDDSNIVARNTTATPTFPVATVNVINIRFQLDFDNCTNIDIDDSFTSTLKSVIRVLVQSCDSFSEIEVLSRECGYNNSALMVAVSITTDTPSTVLNSISEWMSTQPAVFLSKQTFQVNSDCELFISSGQHDKQSLLSCIGEPPTTSITTAASSRLPTPFETGTAGSTPPANSAANDLMIVWISIVAVILLLLLIVVVSLVIVLYLCAKTVQKRGNADLTKTAQSAWDTEHEFVSMNTLRTNSTPFSSQDMLPSLPHRNQLQQSDSQDSSNGVGITRGDLQDNPVYSMGPEEWDQIKREMHDSVDTPPPNYQWAATQGNRTAHLMMSQDSLRSATPIQEKLYQHGNDEDYEDENDPTYAIIRSDACKERRMEIPHQEIQSSQRRSTLPSSLSNRRPLPPHSGGSAPGGPVSPVHYTKPNKYIPHIPGRPVAGRTSSSPALNLPAPYSQPVSSVGSLRNVGITSRPPRQPVMAVPRQLSNRSMSTPNTIQEEEGPMVSTLKTVQESGDGQWYDGEDISDIVTPTTPPVNNYDELNEVISPYAVTPTSLIAPHPYSQPDAGSDWRLSTATGGSSPSTIRPTQHLSRGPPPIPPSPMVAYETIAV